MRLRTCAIMVSSSSGRHWSEHRGPDRRWFHLNYDCLHYGLVGRRAHLHTHFLRHHHHYWHWLTVLVGWLMVLDGVATLAQGWAENLMKFLVLLWFFTIIVCGLLLPGLFQVQLLHLPFRLLRLARRGFAFLGFQGIDAVSHTINFLILYGRRLGLLLFVRKCHRLVCVRIRLST